MVSILRTESVSAIAAATHPEIDAIPVLVVEAEQVRDRAGAFIGMNRDRLAVSQMQMHAAAVIAGDEGAAAVERVCGACGVRVLRMPPSRGAYKPRDTVAIRAIGDIIRRVGEPLAIEILRPLAEAGLAPITSIALRAAEAILINPEYADQVEPAELTRTIVPRRRGRPWGQRLCGDARRAALARADRRLVQAVEEAAAARSGSGAGRRRHANDANAPGRHTRVCARPAPPAQRERADLGLVGRADRRSDAHGRSEGEGAPRWVSRRRNLSSRHAKTSSGWLTPYPSGSGLAT